MGDGFVTITPEVYLKGANILIQKKYNISETEALTDFYNSIKSKYPEEFL